jgi:hypothetical protein
MYDLSRAELIHAECGMVGVTCKFIHRSEFDEEQINASYTDGKQSHDRTK